VPSRDFDTQRVAALAQLDPIEFVLFGREWVCHPMLTPDALGWVDKVRSEETEAAVLAAGLGFVGACVTDTEGWETALRGAVVDGDTLLDLSVWLADTYRKRYPDPPDGPVEAGTPPEPPPPTPRQTAADVEAALAKLRIPAKYGRGEIAGA
jgi:hypothetical protein